MQKRSHSPFLLAAKPLLVEIIDLLEPHFDYISVLATDDRGLSYVALPGETRTCEPMWVQRGFVFRAQQDGRVVEYACSTLPFDVSEPSDLAYKAIKSTSLSGADSETISKANSIAASAASIIQARLEVLLTDPTLIRFPKIPDIPATEEYCGEIEEDPFVADPESILSRLVALRERLTDGKTVVMAQSSYECVDVSRLFVSPKRSLMQSFLWSQAYLFGLARRGNQQDVLPPRFR